MMRMETLPAWNVALFVYFVGSTLYSLFLRSLALKSTIPDRLFPTLFFVGIVYPVGVLVALLWGEIDINWQLPGILLFLGASVSLGIYNTLPFWISKHVDATQYVVISNLYTPMTVILGAFVLHEQFTGWQFLGTLLLLLGAFMVAIKGWRRSSWQFDRHSVILAAATFLIGIGLVLEKASLSYFSPTAYILLGWGVQSVCMVVLARRELPAVRRIGRQDWSGIVKIGLARTAHVLGYFVALSLTRNVALIASLTTFRVPLVFIASWIFLRERDHLVRRLAGVGVATIGLLLL